MYTCQGRNNTKTPHLIVNIILSLYAVLKYRPCIKHNQANLWIWFVIVAIHWKFKYITRYFILLVNYLHILGRKESSLRTTKIPILPQKPMKRLTGGLRGLKPVTPGPRGW